MDKNRLHGCRVPRWAGSAPAQFLFGGTHISTTTKMKTILLPLVSGLCLIALTLVAAETSKPPVFQIRLVLDRRTADSEPLAMTRTDTAGATSQEIWQVQRTSLLDDKAVSSASVRKNAQ